MDLRAHIIKIDILIFEAETYKFNVSGLRQYKAQVQKKQSEIGCQHLRMKATKVNNGAAIMWICTDCNKELTPETNGKNTIR